MQITLDFTEGCIPQIKKGSRDYFFVRCKSSYDGKVRTFGAFYLNEYPLEYEWGCSKCEDIGEDKCPMANGNGCPTTGWFDESSNDGEDRFYESIAGDVIAFVKPPAPETI